MFAKTDFCTSYYYDVTFCFLIFFLIAMKELLLKMWINKAMKSMNESQKKKWLDNHPDFLASYLRTASRELLDQLGVARYERARLSLSLSTSGALLERVVNQQRELSPVPSHILMETDETELFMGLVKDIAAELHVDILCHKILRNVCILTKSDRCSLFLVRGSGQNKYLVSKLFDVSRTTSLEENLSTEKNEIRIPFGKGIIGTVAETKKYINVPDAYKDSRFNKEIDLKTGYHTQNLLCMPILDKDGECIAVANIMNKCDDSTAFTQKDIDLFERYLMFCGIGLTNAQLFEMSVNEFRRNQILLNLARNIFTEQTNLAKLIEKIMIDVQKISNCERSRVYLLQNFAESLESNADNENIKIKDYKSDKEVVFSTAYDINIKEGNTITTLIGSALTQSMSAKVAKDVVVSKKAINLTGLEVRSRYGTASMDENELKMKCVLTMPIFNSKGQIIGVTQQKNKIGKDFFDKSDEKLIEAFSIFTGLGIHNCTMYEHVCKLMAKQKVSLEVLSYHATAQPDETAALVKSDIPKAQHWQLYSFEMDDINMDDFELAKASIRMIIDAGILKKFKVPYEVMCRWVLSVKKNYRPVIYHNWRHAFNVCQSMFSMLYTGKMDRMYNDLEIFSLVVACLCHDLDHRGTNNAYQVKVESPLATLYSTSVMEHHHFNQCIMILNSEGNNIFGCLTSKDYRKALICIEHAILSTDLVVYFSKKAEFIEACKESDRKFNTPARKDLLTSMIMTACDLSATYKPWKVQFRTAKLVASEFFEQGDLERTKLGVDPTVMMDRNKRNELPKLQMGFFDIVCMPLYECFAKFEPRLEPLLTGCKNNGMEWKKLADIENAKVFELEEPPRLTPLGSSPMSQLTTSSHGTTSSHVTTPLTSSSTDNSSPTHPP